MSFKNPYAITNNGKLVHITNYKKEMGKVTCPVCKDELIFCDGLEISSYFRHKTGNIQHFEKDYISATESIRHLEMKEKLIAEKKIPLRSCRWCKKYEEENLKEYTEWRKEVRWFDYVIDVVANVKGFSVLSYLIEVVNTHKCSDKKYKTFEETGVSWMEIDCDGKYLRGNYECDECKTKINFGKYKGESIGKILIIDKEYCEWMWKESKYISQNLLNVLGKRFLNIGRNPYLREEYEEICRQVRKGPQELLKFHEDLKTGFVSFYLSKRKNIEELRILDFGIYKGKNVYEIKDKQYLFWLFNNIDEIYGMSTNFKFFILDAYLSLI